MLNIKNIIYLLLHIFESRRHKFNISKIKFNKKYMKYLKIFWQYNLISGFSFSSKNILIEYTYLSSKNLIKKVKIYSKVEQKNFIALKELIQYKKENPFNLVFISVNGDLLTIDECIKYHLSGILVCIIYY